MRRDIEISSKPFRGNGEGLLEEPSPKTIRLNQLFLNGKRFFFNTSLKNGIQWYLFRSSSFEINNKIM